METPSYPELRAHVEPIVVEALKQINARASQTKSAMPYKTQFLLEEVIAELQKYV
jgi:hypothetical protein